ncbi:MAG: nucleotide-binding protein [Burkholderiales bacterium]|nr:nucleotide-binding protein [Burkholderiales bacterium]
MNKLYIACLLVCAGLATSARAADAPTPPADDVVSGVALEVKDVDAYTYIRLKTKGGETWAAVGRAPVQVGATVSIGDALVMENFESKALKKTFPSIVFGNLAGSNKPAMDPHPAPAAVDAAPIRVDKATGSNARTVAEVIANGVTLKDKVVQVRGKVVKFNPAIVGKNWIHLRDGSGSASDNSNDILVTTQANARLGDVVTVSGVVRADKDFGGGYAYKVLIEEATIQP